MLLVSLGLGWLGFVVLPERDRRNAVLAIQALGGRVEYHKPLNFFQRNDWPRNQLGDGTLLDVESVSQLRGDVTNAVLVHLKEMIQLRSLEPFGTQVTDAGLAQLTGLVRGR